MSTFGSDLLSKSGSAGVKSWVLEKYTRLYDSRNSPMTIERGITDDLSMYLDSDTGRVYVMHNGVAIEDFIMRGTTFPHEVICKDMRILVVIRNQTDGTSAGKFRVRFPSILLCNNFCAMVEGHSRVETYSSWNKEESIMNSTFGRADGEEDEVKQENKLIAFKMRASSSIGAKDESEGPPAEDQRRQFSGEGGVVINVHCNALISDAAMDRFTSMCERVFNRLTGTGPKGGTAKKKNTKPMTAFVRPLPKKRVKSEPRRE